MSERAPVGRCMETASGRFFDFDAPQFDIGDIAFHLANLCRYTGAVRFYSVAEHCVLVSHLARNKLEGLLHDAPEAFIGDMNSPLKRRSGMDEYCRLEDLIYAALAAHFRLPAEICDDTHGADNAAAYIEADCLLKSGGRHWPEYDRHRPLLGTHEIHCWSPAKARREFLTRYREILAASEVGVPDPLPVFHHCQALQETFNG